MENCYFTSRRVLILNLINASFFKWNIDLRKVTALIIESSAESTSDNLTLRCAHWNWSQWAALICGAVRYFYENGFKVWVCGQMKYSLKDNARQCEGQETNEARRTSATLSNYAFPLSFASSRQHTFMHDPKCNTFGIFEVANQQTVTKTFYLLFKSPSIHQQPYPFDQK